MLNHLRKILVLMLVLSIALLGSGIMVPTVRAQAQTNLSASVAPNMQVSLVSGDSTYASTVYAGNSLIFRAKVKNTGNVPLQVTANLTVPQGWDVDQEKYSDCPENLAVQSSCTISWYFTPQTTGQVILRVYARGGYTTSTGTSSRITQSPAFIFNVKPPKGGSSGSSGNGSGSSSGSANPTSVPSTSNLPNMSVTLFSGSSTYASTVYSGNSLIFRAEVKNIGNVPLQVTANLTVPQGWDVDQEKYSDCPENLAVQSSCTISWYFTPQATGQVFLRVYARGGYTTSSSASNRITRSPVFIFNVKPPKASQ